MQPQSITDTVCQLVELIIESESAWVGWTYCHSDDNSCSSAWRPRQPVRDEHPNTRCDGIASCWQQ